MSSPLRLRGNTTRRPVLYNADCTFLFQDHRFSDDDVWSTSVMHNFVDTLADNGVDILLMNPANQVPWFPSKKVPSALDGYTRGDREFCRGHFPSTNVDFTDEMLSALLDKQVAFLNRYLDLLDQGVDWLEEIAKACRRRGVTPWLTIRMNDMHGANSWEGSYMNCALQRDPNYRLSGQGIDPNAPAEYGRQSLDYANPEVRDYMMTLIREVVEDYDFEGLELDWLRSPFCCEAPADTDTIATITEWHIELRELTQAHARQLNKPYPLGVRIPPRLNSLRDIGLDIKGMTEQKLIDFVAPSNFWQTSWALPYEELRADLGDDIAIFGVVENGPNWVYARNDDGQENYRLLSASGPLLRGNAAGKLAMGIDGIELFNFFCSDNVNHQPTDDARQAKYAVIPELNELDSLRGKPKQYALPSEQGPFMFPFFEYAEQLPTLLETNSKRRFRLTMCQEPELTDLRLLVQVVFAKPEETPNLGVSFNGAWPNFNGTATDRLLAPTGAFRCHTGAHDALNFELNIADIREGWNELVVFNRSDTDMPLRVVSVEFAVC